MESNEQTDLISKTKTDSGREQMTASGVGRLGGGGEWSRKEKGLMDMDNSVVIVAGRGHKGTKW